jgi:hypothetical protein
VLIPGAEREPRRRAARGGPRRSSSNGGAETEFPECAPKMNSRSRRGLAPQNVAARPRPEYHRSPIVI